MRPIFLKLLLFVVCLYITCFSFEKVLLAAQQDKADIVSQDELLYFPNGKALELTSFGYRNILANYLWFQTVNYFGKQYRSARGYRWLYHMCNMVTELDPKHKEIYEFCSLLVAWEANEPEQAREILTKGIQSNDYWRLYYLRGMNHLLFEKNDAEAKKDFVLGAKRNGAPLFLKRLATKKLANLDDTQSAIAFLTEMIENSEDDAQRAALTEHLKKIIHEDNFKKLEERKKAYIERYGKAPKKIEELLNSWESKDILKDPFDGQYYIDKEGKIASTSKVDRIALFDKDKKEKAKHEQQSDRDQ